jgi:hypothetical protein
VTIYFIYHGLISVSLLLSYYSLESGSKKSFYLVLVLFATSIVELAAGMAYFGGVKLDWIYHVFNPIEYTLFCLYYIKACEQRKLKSIVKYSIPIFIIFSLCISFYQYGFKSLPGLNINIEGFVLFILYSHLLFCIDVREKMYIYTHPDFWLSTGILIYFGGVFVLCGLYSKIAHLDIIETQNLFIKITLPLNLVLYSCFIIGFICSLRYKKYLM